MPGHHVPAFFYWELVKKKGGDKILFYQSNSSNSGIF